MRILYYEPMTLKYRNMLGQFVTEMNEKCVAEMKS